MPQHEVVACFVCYDATSHIPRRSNDDVDYRMCDRCLSLSENHNWLMETDWDGKKSSPKKFGEGCWIDKGDAERLFGEISSNQTIIFMPPEIWKQFKQDNSEYDFTREPHPTAN